MRSATTTMTAMTMAVDVPVPSLRMEMQLSALKAIDSKFQRNNSSRRVGATKRKRKVSSVPSARHLCSSESEDEGEETCVQRSVKRARKEEDAAKDAYEARCVKLEKAKERVSKYRAKLKKARRLVRICERKSAKARGEWMSRSDERRKADDKATEAPRGDKPKAEKAPVTVGGRKKNMAKRSMSPVTVQLMTQFCLSELCGNPAYRRPLAILRAMHEPQMAHTPAPSCASKSCRR